MMAKIKSWYQACYKKVFKRNKQNQDSVNLSVSVKIDEEKELIEETMFEEETENTGKQNSTTVLCEDALANNNLQEEEITLCAIDRNQDHEKIRVSTSVINEWGLILGASLRGKSHVESDTECQDYHLYESLGNNWYLLIVSDGAGSAKYAARGSRGNCNVAAKLFSEMISTNGWAKENYWPSEMQWYIECRSIFEKMKLIYRSKAEEETEETVEKDFNATIIVCLLTPRGILSAHIGDGRMGYLSSDGEWRALMTPHKGEEANQTIFLQNSWTYPQVPALKISGVWVPEVRVINEVPKAIVLISDGCEKATWQCSMYNEQHGKYEDVNKPHPQFLNPLIDAVVNEKSDNQLQLFTDIIDKGTPACQRERDDKTILLAINKDYYDLSHIEKRENNQS